MTWTSTGGKLSVNSSQTGSAGGATVKLTSDVPGSFTVTGTVDEVTETSETIIFTAPVKQ